LRDEDAGLRGGEIRSDDSLGDEGEDVGIVMRKSTRGLRLGGKERRALFSLDRSGGEEEEDDDDDIELGGVEGEEMSSIVEAFERLGIDVRTPEGIDDDDEEEGFEKGKGRELDVD
jgi:hypothetical protein